MDKTAFQDPVGTHPRSVTFTYVVVCKVSRMSHNRVADAFVLTRLRKYWATFNLGDRSDRASHRPPRRGPIPRVAGSRVGVKSTTVWTPIARGSHAATPTRGTVRLHDRPSTRRPCPT